MDKRKSLNTAYFTHACISNQTWYTPPGGRRYEETGFSGGIPSDRDLGLLRSVSGRTEPGIPPGEFELSSVRSGVLPTSIELASGGRRDGGCGPQV